jgi:hypothetical protein
MTYYIYILKLCILLDWSVSSSYCSIILCGNFSLCEEWHKACSYVASVIQMFAIGASLWARSSVAQFQTIFLNDFKIMFLYVPLATNWFLPLKFSNHVATFITWPLLTELSFCPVLRYFVSRRSSYDYRVHHPLRKESLVHK